MVEFFLYSFKKLIIFFLHPESRLAPGSSNNNNLGYFKTEIIKLTLFFIPQEKLETFLFRSLYKSVNFINSSMRVFASFALIPKTLAN